ncbi:MAG: hypothetical protein ACYCPS_01285 [Candidatus Saccharimonadales bacterium]
MVDCDSAEFFVSQSEEPNGKSLSVYYAPSSEGLALLKVIVRVKSVMSSRQGEVWEAITGRLSVTEPMTPTIEPSTVEQVGNAIKEFMKSNIGGGIFVDDSTPQVIKDELRDAEEALKNESRARLADFLGVQLGDSQLPVASSSELKTGLYL